MNTDLLRQRARFIQSTRQFFIDRGYLEVETPLLSPFLLPEPSLEVFETAYVDFQGDRHPLYLIPSPELWMKRLLAAGSGSLFQITKSFRNIESLEKYHNPEFSLLEWYTVDHDYMDSVGVLEELLSHLCAGAEANRKLCPPCRRLSMREAFRMAAGLDLDNLMEWENLYRAGKSMNLSVGEMESWETIFNKIFLTYVEPALPAECPLILFDYPAEIPTLARQRGMYSERWELYINGIEIANCYTEETSSEAVERFIRSERLRKEHGRIPHRVDWDFPLLFKEDYPDCSGVALGMDRLFMVISGMSSIDGVIAFPLSKIMT